TPNARVLVTSREPLQVESEQRYPVEPLPDNDAAALFVERARAVVPAFSPTPAVDEICRRLDGLPLAIELAAARVALLDPDELLARLDQRLPLLASRSRDAPERQRTLRATIEWSYDLLEPKEQQLFRRLAVFRGSFSLEAAEAVGGADLSVLELLLLKSLVRRWGTRLGLSTRSANTHASVSKSRRRLRRSTGGTQSSSLLSPRARTSTPASSPQAGSTSRSRSPSRTTSAVPSPGRSGAVRSRSDSKSRPRSSSSG